MSWTSLFLVLFVVMFCFGSTTILIGYLVTGGPRRHPGFWRFVGLQLAVVTWVTLLFLLAEKILN